MKNTITVFAAMILGGLIFAIGSVSAQPSSTGEGVLEFAAGSGWTEIDCSAAAAYSAALARNAKYAVQAIGENTYWAVTTAGSAQDADSSDGYIPTGEVLVLRTPATADRYISCDGSAGGTGKLRYVQVY